MLLLSSDRAFTDTIEVGRFESPALYNFVAENTTESLITHLPTIARVAHAYQNLENLPVAQFIEDLKLDVQFSNPDKAGSVEEGFYDLMNIIYCFQLYIDCNADLIVSSYPCDKDQYRESALKEVYRYLFRRSVVDAIDPQTYSMETTRKLLWRLARPFGLLGSGINSDLNLLPLGHNLDDISIALGGLRPTEETVFAAMDLESYFKSRDIEKIAQRFPGFFDEEQAFAPDSDTAVDMLRSFIQGHGIRYVFSNFDLLSYWEKRVLMHNLGYMDPQLSRREFQVKYKMDRLGTYARHIKDSILKLKEANSSSASTSPSIADCLSTCSMEIPRKINNITFKGDTPRRRLVESYFSGKLDLDRALALLTDTEIGIFKSLLEVDPLDPTRLMYTTTEISEIFRLDPARVTNIVGSIEAILNGEITPRLIGIDGKVLKAPWFESINRLINPEFLQLPFSDLERKLVYLIQYRETHTNRCLTMKSISEKMGLSDSQVRRLSAAVVRRYERAQSPAH